MHAMRHSACRACIGRYAVQPFPVPVARHFSASVQHRSANGGHPSTPTPNPRWLTDLQSRIKGCLSKDPKRAEAAGLQGQLQYLNDNWLNLSAGREGFITEDRFKGVNRYMVPWGDMDSMGHVNNIMYNRYAETGRVNWITSFAANAEGERRRQWFEIMSPRGIGFILKSIKTDYKVPVQYPDRVTVMHKLAQRPDYTSQSVFLDAVIYSEAHKRPAARCYEDIAIYDYKAKKLATLHDFMVEELQKVYDLQEKTRAETDKKVEELTRQVEEIENRAGS